MKTLGLCFLLLSFVLLANVAAPAQSDGLALNTNKDAIKKWLARNGKSEQEYPVSRLPQDNNFVISTDELEPGCMYMRTYRVKREARDSDSTRPAGYTTCVAMGRFGVKRAILPEGAAQPRDEY